MEAWFSAPVHNGPGVHPSSYAVGTGFLPGVKRPGRGADHSPQYSAEDYSCVHLLSVFVACSRVKFITLGPTTYSHQTVLNILSFSSSFSTRNLFHFKSHSSDGENNKKKKSILVPSVGGQVCAKVNRRRTFLLNASLSTTTSSKLHIYNSILGLKNINFVQKYLLTDSVPSLTSTFQHTAQMFQIKLEANTIVYRFSMTFHSFRESPW